MDIATESATAKVKEKDLLDGTQATESSHLSPVVMATIEALLRVSKTVGCVQIKDFQNLYETQ